MVKLVYTYALGAYAERRVGSSPVSGTKILNFLSEKESSVKKDIMKKKSGTCPDFFFDYDKSLRDLGNAF